jgi:hypothetical protein
MCHVFRSDGLSLHYLVPLVAPTPAVLQCSAVPALWILRHGLLNAPHQSLYCIQVEPLLAALPPALYQALPYALVPVVGNPIKMAMARVPADTPLTALPTALPQALLQQLSVLGDLGKALPQETLLFKLHLLESGCEYMASRYIKVPSTAARLGVRWPCMAKPFVAAAVP